MLSRGKALLSAPRVVIKLSKLLFPTSCIIFKPTWMRQLELCIKSKQLLSSRVNRPVSMTTAQPTSADEDRVTLLKAPEKVSLREESCCKR